MTSEINYLGVLDEARQDYAEGDPVIAEWFDSAIREVQAEAWDQGRRDGLYDGRARNHVSFLDRKNPYRD